MSNTWKPRLLCAALVGMLAVIGCFDFGTALDNCREDGRCEPEMCNKTDENDQPDDDFKDTNCDYVDGIADAGVFVDPVAGSDTGQGTLTDPLKTLGKALEKVRMGTAPPIVYLAQGSYHEPGLVIDTPVSLYGSYARRENRWDRDAGFITSLEGDTVGLVIRGISGDAGVVLERLTVTSANATDAGMPSIALKVIDSQGIRLRHSTFIAGQGAPGTHGAQGAPGNDGGMGQAGQNADANVASGVIAQGGTSGCPGTGQAGGSGNQGATNGSAGAMGSAGNPAATGGAGGPGGDAGVPVVIDPDTGDKRCRAGPGGMGVAGLSGDPGPSGPRGEGVGMVSDETWIATQQGGDGTTGTAGSGGGGGGSGGSCPLVNPIVGAAGGGSGGGGGGGCGGEGGRGGTGGGASIAVLLIRSNVQWEGTTTLKTGGGGRGGNGGEGGPGGPGGPGGFGGDGGIIQDTAYTSFGGSGGAGGPGGPGGAGGPGGGGGGGPSVGVWCWDAGYADMGTLDTQGVANGGPGGTTAAGGNPGQAGAKDFSHDCPP